jgi:hypothetical protein
MSILVLPAFVGQIRNLLQSHASPETLQFVCQKDSCSTSTGDVLQLGTSSSVSKKISNPVDDNNQEQAAVVLITMYITL